MKKLIYAILSIGSLLAEPIDLLLAPNVLMNPAKQGFFYVRFTTAEGDLFNGGPIRPGLGLGYRRLAGNGAADISVNGLGHAERKGGEFFWSAPKATYVHYMKPSHDQSFYAGGGLAWGGIDRKAQDFIGLIPSATFGYEFLRKHALGFAELNISQPAISVYRRGAFPSPVAELSVGVGF